MDQDHPVMSKGEPWNIYMCILNYVNHNYSFKINEVSNKISEVYFEFFMSIIGQKRRDEIYKSWEALREPALSTYFEAQAPMSKICIMCDEKCDHPILCDQCGPLFIACPSCASKSHSTYAIFHKPRIWKVTL